MKDAELEELKATALSLATTADRDVARGFMSIPNRTEDDYVALIASARAVGALEMLEELERSAAAKPDRSLS